MDAKVSLIMTLLMFSALSLAEKQLQQQQQQQHQQQQQQQQHQHQCQQTNQKQQQHCQVLEHPDYEEHDQHNTDELHKEEFEHSNFQYNGADENDTPESSIMNGNTEESMYDDGNRRPERTQHITHNIPNATPTIVGTGESEFSNEILNGHHENKRFLKHDPAHSAKKEDGQAVTVAHLNSKEDFEKFIREEAVHLVYFYKKGGITSAVRTFVKEFQLSARQLIHYKIFLAMVDCDMHLVPGYCAPDKVSRFAYGFRDGAEKIAFPLDTLFNANAIVSSALHLSLINNVPILQSASERQSLEQRCKGRADIIFAFHRNLGTYEHRIFLEIAYAYQDKYVFALTTYTAGTLGLRELQQAKQEDQEEVNQLVWVIQCASHSVSQECIDSPYRGKMLLPDLLNFMTIVSKPKWSELSVPSGSDEVLTPYDSLGLPWVFLIHDGASRKRMKDLAPNLAELVRGAVAVFTVDLEVLNDENLSKVGLHRDKVHAPALAFLSPGQHSANFLNDFDDALEWVMEQVDILEKDETQKSDEDVYPPSEPLAELQQDDEVVLGMQKEEMFTELQAIVGEEAYRQTMTSGGQLIIAYFLSWDPVSNALLQHLQGIVPTLSEAGSTALVRTVNCFDWPRICDNEGVLTYPVLKMFSKKNRNITYNGPIHGDYILKTVFLFEEVFPIEVKSDLEFEEILSLKLNTNAAHSSNSVAIGLYPNTEGAYEFKKSIKPLFGKYMVAYFVSVNKVQKICATNNGCILISKPKDIFQPHCVLNENLDDSDIIINFIQENSRHIFDVLEPERFSGLGPNGDSSKHVILFLPANVSLVPSDKHNFHAKMSYQETNINSSEQQNYKTPQVKNKGDEILQSEKDIYTTWNLIGNLAAENTNPDIIFSWIKSNDPVAMEVLPVYGLDENVASVALVDRGTAQVYTTYAQKRNLREWLDDALNSNIHPNLKLPEEAWEPRLPGFDYLKFMMEDQDREAEDHLILEMEREIIPKTGESSNMVKEEL